MNLPWDKIEKTVSCWNWTGCLYLGYGKWTYNGKTVRAHKKIYELLVSEIPKGFELDHLCRNKKCVNPAHLEPVTHAENIRRAQPFRKHLTKTHCKQGHLFLPENMLKISRSKNPVKICKICKLESMRKYDTKKRLAKKQAHQ